MAETTRLTISYSLQDEWGIDATCVLYAFLDPSTTVTQLITEYQSTSLLLDAITGAKLLPGRITISVDPDAGVKGSAVAGARVEQTGVFDFTDVSVGRVWGDAVPAIANTVITAGRIDPANTDVVAWVGNLLASFTTGHYTNPAMEHLGAIKDTFISFRKHRRALHRESLSDS